jgi:carboxypeptidase C (cathepsin A)
LLSHSLLVFFKKNPKYNRDFFIFGESYAGHYIPAFGSRIVAGNKNLKRGDVRIDFKGI